MENKIKKGKNWAKGKRKNEALFMDFCRFCSMDNIAREKEYGFSTVDAWRKGKGTRGKDVSTATTARWQASDDFFKIVRGNWRAWGKNNTPNILKALQGSAIRGGKAPEVKLWMQIFEDFEEKLETNDIGAREEIKKIQDSLRDIVNKERSKK